MKSGIGISANWVKLFMGLMFFFLISLVFMCSMVRAEEPLIKTDKQMRIYMKYSEMGKLAAKEDNKNGHLWQHYHHKMTETLKEQAFREGYLDYGAYYAMPVVKKIEWDLTNPNWKE